jgi:uncharacterized protein (DUF1330 family)
MDQTMRSFVEKAGALLTGIADDQPVVMINLLRYRELAAYAPDSGLEGCSGREAYDRYWRAAIRFVRSIGGSVVWQGAARAVVLGPSTERWDDVLLVRYPSKQAFLEMIGNPEYQAVTVHRTAALEDSRLIATLPTG